MEHVLIDNLPFYLTNITTQQSGRIIATSRRVATVKTGDGNEVRCRMKKGLPDLVAGDAVMFTVSSEEAVIEKLCLRKNLFYRSLEHRTKLLASNIDILLLVTAPPPLFNPYFLDRALVAAACEEIPVLLLANKADVNTAEGAARLQPYYTLPLDLMITSVQNGDGISDLRMRLANSALQLVLLCGVSGVGKSSLLKSLIPTIQRNTQQVSKKTGQGKQTTTQSRAFSYPRPSAESLFIVDSPGLQQFGLGHITPEQLRSAFYEFAQCGKSCRFADCQHIEEKDCGVKDALAEGTIAESRYTSYLHILEELKRQKKY